MLDLALAFLEGIALILSPCILPVLPLILSASLDGGKSRPFGIIAGFILSFSAFAMVSRKLVAAFHVDLDIIKYTSLTLLALLGLVLLSSKLSEWFNRLTQGAASLGSRVGGSGEGGFVSGMGIGALIGLVWTPCAGPILAAVLVQVIRQENDLLGSFTVAAFALGAGVPMLLIALTGRKMMDRLGFFKAHAETVRKAFGALILLSVAFIASGVDAQSLFARKTDATANETMGLQEGLSAPYPAPEFTGIDRWFNSKPLTIAALKGKVVLIDFWTYSCINCVRTLPYITEWDKKYRDQGLVIVGMHAPEFEFEKSAENVQAAIAKHGIRYPVAQDNRLDTWTAFRNRYWPAHYLIDREGRVVYTHFGEGEYARTENNIRFLLGLQNKVQEEAAPAPFAAGQTPETYLGYDRAEHFSGKETPVRDAFATYAFPSFIPQDGWALSGSWKIGKEKITGEKGAALRLNFRARKVYLVLGTESGTPIPVTLSLNGEPAAAVTVKEHTLYELVDQKEAKNSLLELTAESPGLEAYAFTFGN